MNSLDATDVIHTTLWTLLFVGAPFVLVTVVSGTAISILQALTQIQESTLTFVPKIVLIGLVAVMTGPFVGDRLMAFSMDMFRRVVIGFE